MVGHCFGKVYINKIKEIVWWKYYAICYMEVIRKNERVLEKNGREIRILRPKVSLGKFVVFWRLRNFIALKYSNVTMIWPKPGHRKKFSYCVTCQKNHKKRKINSC
jgi:hypothetical protein